MQKLPVVIALASLVAITSVATAQQDEAPASGTPSVPAADDHSSPVSPSQPPPSRPFAITLMQEEANSALDRAFKPSGEATSQARKLFEEGDLVGAETWCRRALTLAPIVSGKPWYGDEVPLLGDILLAQGRSEEALECYLKDVNDQRLRGALEPDDPDHPTPNLNAALAYCRLGNFEMAQKYYPDAVIAERVSPEWLAESPGIGDLRTRQASLLLIRGGKENSTASYSRALPYLKAAEKLAPENWMIVDRVGQTLYDLNRYEEAITSYRRAMKLGGDKVAYEHRIKVEMYDYYLQQKNKQQKQNKQQEKAPQ